MKPWVFGVGQRRDEAGTGDIFYTLVTPTARSGVDVRGGAIAEFRERKPALLLAAILHNAEALPFLDPAYVQGLREAAYGGPAATGALEISAGVGAAGAQFTVSWREGLEGIVARPIARLATRADAEQLVTLLTTAERLRL